MNIDYHVHPGYSKDASGSLEDYCKKAVEIGLDEMCFTPHLDIDPARAEINDWINMGGKIVSMRSDWLVYYFSQLEEMRRSYGARGLRLKAGIEVDYAPHIEDELTGIISAHPFDYVLGSVHCLDHIAISSGEESPLYFKGKTMDEVLAHYFSAVAEAVRSELFDCMAHLDGYRKYGHRQFGDEIHSPRRDLVEPVLQLMADRGVGLELNSSGFRHGLEEPYPGLEILAWAKEIGVSVPTCGSDAHSVDDLGEGLGRANRILKDLGFPQPCGFSRREAKRVR